MDNSIIVKKLSRRFKVYLKKTGLLGSLKGLVKRTYKTINAVNSINFNIKQGELVGFIGPNGAGKTTTLKMLSGLLYPTDGLVSVLGYTPFEKKEDFLKQISLVMGQKNQLWWDLPAIETFNLQKELYDISHDQYQNALNELTSMLGVKDIISQQVRQLSLGQRMKCELIAALLHKPKILFLDEPTIGLDIFTQKIVRKFIKEYNKKHRATIILTSHYMDDVKEICKRIIMINKGMIVFDGDIDSLTKEYADYKIINFISSTQIKKEELEKIGKIKEFNSTKATIYVKRDETSKKAAELLSQWGIEDLEIIEPALEDIVRSFF